MRLHDDGAPASARGARHRRGRWIPFDDPGRSPRPGLRCLSGVSAPLRREECRTLPQGAGSVGWQQAAGDSKRRETAEEYLLTLSVEAKWIWSDGSAEERIANGGDGALLILGDGERREVRVAAGRLCSSTRAELYSIRAAL